MITDMHANLKTAGLDLAASTLLIAPDSRWSTVIDQLSAAVHAADFWRSPETGKPLTVGEARELKQFAARTPVGEYKIACLLDADRFRLETANALLKLVEEPPEYLFLVLFAETARLLPTLRSRVRTIYLPEDSATIERVDNPRTLWRNVLTAGSLASPQDRERVRELLYLYPLVHEGIKPEPVLDSFKL